jgi:toxin ParE1/3/4
MKFWLRPRAKNDLLDIVDHYTGISAELAERFTVELNSTLLGLCSHPGLGSRRYAHFLPDQSLRCWHLDRFPFLVFYRVGGNSLSVLRILHERRDLSASLIDR